MEVQAATAISIRGGGGGLSTSPSLAAVSSTTPPTGIRISHARGIAYAGAGYWREPVMMIVYGIKNCDTMKKARAWLDGHGIAYAFHDYKAAGIEKARLEGWVSQLGWEALLNRAGTTFRKLPDAEKEGLTEKKAIALMLAQPSMIKRPVLEQGGKIITGFRLEQYEKLLKR
jgi:arsenate reductase